MTPEQLVPTLETCKLLKEAGWDKETLLYYVIFSYNDGMRWVLVTQITIVTEANYIIASVPAPTLQELLEDLPQDTTPVNVLNVVKSYSGDFSVGYWDCTTQQIEPEFLDTNPAEAAALLWLELHKEVSND